MGSGFGSGIAYVSVFLSLNQNKENAMDYVLNCTVLNRVTGEIDTFHLSSNNLH